MPGPFPYHSERWICRLHSQTLRSAFVVLPYVHSQLEKEALSLLWHSDLYQLCQSTPSIFLCGQQIGGE